MKLCNITFNKEKLILDILYTAPEPKDLTFVITDLNMDCPYYIWDVNLSNGSAVWISPLPGSLISVVKSGNSFSGFRCKVYHNRKLIQYEEFPYSTYVRNTTTPFISTEFDVVGHSYLDFFHSDLCEGIDFTGTVVDAGANVGFFTLLALQNKANRIYSIEPDDSAFFCLERNFETNPSVILIQKALTNVCGTTEFFYTESNVANSEIRPASPHMTGIVDTINLQTIFNIERYINLIKLDIEGGEFKVLGGVSIEEYNRVNQFFIEFHGIPTPIEHRLTEVGFSVEYRRSSRDNTAGFIYAKNMNRPYL